MRVCESFWSREAACVLGPPRFPVGFFVFFGGGRRFVTPSRPFLTRRDAVAALTHELAQRGTFYPRRLLIKSFNYSNF